MAAHLALAAGLTARCCFAVLTLRAELLGAVAPVCI